MKTAYWALPLGALVVTAGLGWGFARNEADPLTRPLAPAHATAVQRGAAAFEGGDFGGLSTDALATHAIPWRLIAAALVLDARIRDSRLPASRRTLDSILAGFGFLPHATVANRPSGLGPRGGDLPLGFTAGDLAPVGGSVVRVANLGCAACHAGVAYKTDGQPDPGRAMLGTPNTSLDLEAYTLTVFRALRATIDDDRLLPTAATLFPEMGWRERQSLRWLVLPLARKRLADLAGQDRPMPFPNGSPGSTNGVAALKAAIGVPLLGGGAEDSGIVSVPDLGDRMAKTSLLADGSYAVPGQPRSAPVDPDRLRPQDLRVRAAIATFFTVPSMGVHPDRALRNLDDATDIAAFLTRYRPQRFPAPVDAGQARRGAAVYAGACASCHGNYSNGPSPRLRRYPNWIGEVGTDRLRAEVFDDALVAAVGKSLYRDRIAVARGGGYVAPPLTGIWASAPYLHNGSIPTLAALLSPSERPAGFLVGGHALDMDRVGLRLGPDGRYPPGYRPFSTPAWLDTRKPGRGNDGHRFGEALGTADKAALIAFLKTL